MNTDITPIIEMIKSNNLNSNKRLDDLGEKLVEHISDNNRDFHEIKELVKDVHTSIEKSRSGLKKIIEPIQVQMVQHEKQLEQHSRDISDCVKQEMCRNNEAAIRNHIKTLSIKIILFNLSFMVLYIMILLNTNLKFDWGALSKIIGAIGKLL